MKKILSLFAMFFLCISIFAQKDVTKFLGIPVDGSKTQMRQKLIAKGYTPKRNGKDEYFSGEFNGYDVYIRIVTTNNKVSRIMVADAETLNEANIKIRFNNLVDQFKNNKRYLSLSDQSIAEDVNIQFEQFVNKKTFDAIFYQKPETDRLDKNKIQEQVMKELLTKFTEEEIKSNSEQVQTEKSIIQIRMASDLLTKKVVWFRISEFGGEYYISMFYDNEYNRANGEDL